MLIGPFPPHARWRVVAIGNHAGTARFTTCIGILMGLNVVPSSNKKAEERDQVSFFNVF